MKYYSLEEIKEYLTSKGVPAEDKNIVSLKSIYGGKIYFYTRELKQDHYFIDNKDFKSGMISKIYHVPYNPDNFNPEITEMGNSTDSFVLKELSNSIKVINLASEINNIKDDRKEVKNEVGIEKSVVIMSIENRLKEISVLLTKL